MAFKSGYVALIGRPNVGKSTLINAILGENLSIITPKPQTTRHRITGILNSHDSQVIFLDTPGYHESDKTLNAAMNEVVDSVIDDADIVCLMIGSDQDDVDIEEGLFRRIGKDRCVVVINKADLVLKGCFETIANRYRDGWGVEEVVFISALTGDGLEALVDIIRRRLPEGVPFFPQDLYTDHTVRFLAAELIREQFFLKMHEEIPYSGAVEIEEFKDPTGDNPVTRIRAAIIVERDSQKAMVIGKDGQRIKEIGRGSRENIERLVGGKVFLELVVKVEKNWTKDKEAIRRFGYGK